jgi:Patched family
MLSVFTAFALSRRHKVYSRSLLGIGAVITCLLSITTAYGLLMICGVPVTTATQMLPFVVMGIGLDDAFIIMGSFTRKDSSDIAECVWLTIEDIGVSIFLTSLTSSLAFALGCFSNIPTIYWMSLYAFPMIIIDFIYQITFFVALLVLDERRIQQNRRDVCTWITVPTYSSPQGKCISSANAHDTSVQNPEKTITCAIENTVEERYIMVPLSPPREEEDSDLASQAATIGHYKNEQIPQQAQRAEREVQKNTNFETQLFENEQATSAAMSSHSDEAQLSNNEDLGSNICKAQGLLSRLCSARVEKQVVNTPSMSQSSEAHQSENEPLPPIEADNSRSYEMKQPENENPSLPSNEMHQLDNSPKRSTSSDMLATASVCKDRTDRVADRLMSCYGEYLLRPWVKGLVILGFSLLAVMGSFSASKLTQKFEFTDLMPDDSYAIDFFDAIESYSLQATVSPYVYFRDVDQSDQVIQQQMGEYVVDLVLGVDAIVLGPNAFWLRDFHDYVDFAGIQDLDFNAQLDQFLNVPVLFEMYNGDIIRDENGTLLSSRCMINMVNMPKVDHLQESIEALHQQRAVTMEQPINSGSPDGPFFTYGEPYNIWEFFAVCLNQLTKTMVTGVIAVSIISIFFVPHWTAVFYVTPLVCILNVELLGVLQWAGMHVNAITYITVFMAIGIFVDYIMHVLFRYYEVAGNRRDKTLEMLSTMGTSILLGGLSTLLGTVPLIFCSSGIFYTVFVTAFGIVILGLGHGLILLPVLLSIFGTEEQVIIHSSVTQSFEDGTNKRSRRLPLGNAASVSGDSRAESDGVNGSGGSAEDHDRLGTGSATVEITKENSVDPSTANVKSGRASATIDSPTKA